MLNMENTSKNIPVTTYNGKTANRRDCRYIKGEFYIKNIDCFNINNTWYRINSGMIALDHETNTWVLIHETDNLVKGVIAYKDDNAVLGYFTTNKLKNVSIVIPNGEYLCISEDILPSSEFIISPYDLKLYHISVTNRPTKINTNLNLNNHIYGQLVYNVKNMDAAFMGNVVKSTKDFLKNKEYITSIGKHASDIISKLGYSYGIEFETSGGNIPYFKLKEGGLLPLRDGSIRGIEFATIPYNSDIAIKGVEQSCKTLSKFTTFSVMESLHLHIGTLPDTSKEYISILYTLCAILEDEIYSMFPAYYKNTSKFKAKDYNAPLLKSLVRSNLLETFDNISTYLAAGKRFEGFGSAHPSDPDGTHKWGISQRYHYVNFIPLLFGNNKTIEFRIHVPSNNPIKVINWMLICSAIIKYAEIFKKSGTELSALKNKTLADIINTVYHNDYRLVPYLLKYIDYRKDMRKRDDEMSIYDGRTEIQSDASYSKDF